MKPEPHPVQLRSIWTERVNSRRLPAEPDELAHLRIPRAQLRTCDVELGTFECTLRLTLRWPTNEATWSVVVSLVALFGSSPAVDETQARAFARDSALYVMWPYARSYIAELGAQAGFSPPPLPLIVRPATQALPRSTD